MALERIEALYGKEQVKSLSDKCVAVIGVGGVGSHVAECLARSGIGKLILVDFDTVDISNINRQIPARKDTIGLLKVEVMAEHLQKILDINIEACNYQLTPETLKESIPWDRIHALIDCIDDVKTKVAMLAECQIRKIPCVTALGAAKKENPWNFCYGDLTSEVPCPLATVVRKRLNDMGIEPTHIVGVYSNAPHNGPVGKVRGTIGFLPAIEGFLCASILIRYFIRNPVIAKALKENWWEISELENWTGDTTRPNFDASRDTYILPSVAHLLHHYQTSNYDVPDEWVDLEKQVKYVLGIETGTVVFTSSATESINMWIRAAVSDIKNPHIVYTSIDHPSIPLTIESLDMSLTKTVIQPDLSGKWVDFDRLRSPPDVVVFPHIHNESGLILPVELIVNKLRAMNPNIRIFVDTTQTFGRMVVDMIKEWDIDGFCGSGHKFYGPRHTGFLWMKHTIPKKAFIEGVGGQELRGGSDPKYPHALMVKALKYVISPEALNTYPIIASYRNLLESAESKEVEVISFDKQCPTIALLRVSDVVYEKLKELKCGFVFYTIPMLGIKGNIVRVSWGLDIRPSHFQQLFQLLL
ncbi:unnamed protein product [Adineta steineri]|uniref:Uncharacterized protein n=1 Tax=Adineta steineri TaxID=433720 RepID=A0A815L5X6_9BILA|nr:unnamed protein product [Adineta steineri]CAF1615582.1 unnamed protein product [Adineta steineri]